HCPVSGATKVLKNGTAIVLMSFRYKTDDHFWFTLFHELGHLLLHKSVDMHLECEEMDVGEAEQEANDFAANVLVPTQYRSNFADIAKSKFGVVRFARRLDVSPGIVVGQLQHAGLLRRNQLNFLKQKFSWHA